MLCQKARVHPLVTLAAYQSSLSDGGGWIGGWSSGIGDPNFVGWLTVVAYFAAAFGAFRLRGRFSPHADLLRRRERRFWAVLAAILLFLCINKQLDLQTAMTELFRICARREGWYAQRRLPQLAFIAGLAIALPVDAAVVFRVTRGMAAATKLARVGLAVIGGFVLIRAASFHHVDRLLGATLLHFKLNWIFELGGIAIVLVGVGRRWKQLNLGPHGR